MKERVEPFKVFISSSQKEFQDLRNDLKAEIDQAMVTLVYQRIFRAVLVEHKKGMSIPSDIDEGLNDSAIYVGIFGREYSEYTVEEYLKARSKMLPVLIYRFRKDKKISGVISGRSKVDKFLRNEVERYGIRIRGPFFDETKLIEDIITDLVFQMVEMVKECAGVRKTIAQ